MHDIKLFKAIQHELEVLYWRYYLTRTLQVRGNYLFQHSSATKTVEETTYASDFQSEAYILVAHQYSFQNCSNLKDDLDVFVTDCCRSWMQLHLVTAFKSVQ